SLRKWVRWSLFEIGRNSSGKYRKRGFARSEDANRRYSSPISSSWSNRASSTACTSLVKPCLMRDNASAALCTPMPLIHCQAFFFLSHHTQHLLTFPPRILPRSVVSYSNQYQNLFPEPSRPSAYCSIVKYANL